MNQTALGGTGARSGGRRNAAQQLGDSSPQPADRMNRPSFAFHRLVRSPSQSTGMRLFAPTARRAETWTPGSVNRRIRNETEQRVAKLAGKPALIQQRLRELDEEWDIERWLETGSSTLTLTGLGLGVFRDRRWLLLSAAVQGFFMQHALQGWCPPLPIFRSLGVRTQREIEAERHALKALLGDYKRANGPQKANSSASARRVFQNADQ